MAVSQGEEIQIAELRGWLRGIAGAGECNVEEAGADYHYVLELDTDWALAQGINLHKILRVGNIAHISIMQAGATPRKAFSIPLINVELNSWGWRSRFPPANKPQDWTHRQENCPQAVEWPFDPDQPDHSRPQLQVMDGNARGSYVRISGALVTDHPHDVQHRPGTFFCRWFAICNDIDAEWESSVPDWAPGKSADDPDHPARYTEIHPPDLIEVLDPPQPRATVRGVALVARVAATPGPIIPSCEKQEFEISPEIPRPPRSKVAYEELRGPYPETHFPWGENSDNGSWVQVFDDRIHVRAQVCGGAIGGSPGRFKAIYRVWWQPSVGTSPPRCCPAGKRCCGGCNNGRCDDACVRPGQQCP